jgi:hypothetical protein
MRHRRRWGREVFRARQRRAADTIYHIAIVQYDRTVRQNPSRNVLWLELVPESTQLIQDLAELLVVGVPVPRELVAKAVHEAGHLVLVNTLRFGKGLGIVESAAEAVILEISYVLETHPRYLPMELELRAAARQWVPWVCEQ